MREGIDERRDRWEKEQMREGIDKRRQIREGIVERREQMREGIDERKNR